MIDKSGVQEGIIAFGEASNELRIIFIVIGCLFGLIFLGGLVSHLVGSKKATIPQNTDTD